LPVVSRSTRGSTFAPAASARRNSPGVGPRAEAQPGWKARGAFPPAAVTIIPGRVRSLIGLSGDYSEPPFYSGKHAGSRG
jgi:hypothetical protein